jgi:hypothetical protein
VRLLACVALGAAAIAAFGFERLRLAYSRDRVACYALLKVPAALAAAALVVFVLTRQRHAAAGGLTSQIRATLFTEFVLLALIAWTVVCIRRGLRVGTMLAGISFLVAGELLYQGARFYRYGDPGLLYPHTPLIDFLQQQHAPFRVLGDGRMLYPNSNVFAGIEEIRTHDPAERRDYVEFLDATCQYDPRPYFKDIGNPNAAALDFLNVKYFVSSPDRGQPGPKWIRVYRGADGSVFENLHVLPRVFSPGRVVWMGRAANQRWDGKVMQALRYPLSALAHLEDWHEVAYVLGRAFSAEDNPNVNVTEYQESAGRITFRTITADPAAIVISVVQDGGWRAEQAPGSTIETFRANGPFLALVVPGGKQQITLTYTEPGFTLGLCCSALAAAALVMLQILASTRRTSRTPAISANPKSGQ